MPMLDQDLEERLRILVMDDALISVTPAITAEIYHANDVIGGIQTLTSVARVADDRVVLQSLTVTDLAIQDAVLRIFFFNQNPTNGTYTDNAALDIDDIDMGFCQGWIEVAASLYADAADNSLATVRNISLGLSPTGSTSLFAIAQVTGGPTYVSTADLTFKYYFLRG